MSNAWRAEGDHLRELLRLRTEALARVTAQLDAVRKLHVAMHDPEWQHPFCFECDRRYPCQTAKAAGVPE